MLDEKEDLVQERDAYKCKVHRLNHSMAALLKSNTYKLVPATFKSYVYSYKQNFLLKIRLRWYRRSDWLKNEHSNYLGLKEASVFLKMGQTQPLFVLFIFVLFL